MRISERESKRAINFGGYVIYLVCQLVSVLPIHYVRCAVFLCASVVKKAFTDSNCPQTAGQGRFGPGPGRG